jgi:hypothetical protein
MVCRLSVQTILLPLVPVPPPATPPLTEAASQAERYFRTSQAANTRRANAATGGTSFPGVRPRGGKSPRRSRNSQLYLSALAQTAKNSNLTRRVSALSQAHQAAGFDSPIQHLALRKVMAGIRREKRTAQNGKRPVETGDLHAPVATLSSKRIFGGARPALLLLGFAGAFRHSELVGLQVDYLEINPKGLIVKIGRSKTDPEGQGRRVGIPYGSTPAACPVRPPDLA